MSLPPLHLLTTERLLLRPLTLNDANEIFLLRSDDVVNQYLGRAKATSLQEAIDFINKINFGSRNQQSFYWAICLNDSDSLVGTICLWNFSPQGGSAEIGYELLPRYHGKGIMQEALTRVLDFAFTTVQLSTIEAWTTQQNVGSIRLLERNHFARDQNLEKNIDRNVEGPDLVIYVLSKEQSSSAAVPV